MDLFASAKFRVAKGLTASHTTTIVAADYVEIGHISESRIIRSGRHVDAKCWAPNTYYHATGLIGTTARTVANAK